MSITAENVQASVFVKVTSRDQRSGVKHQE